MVKLIDRRKIREKVIKLTGLLVFSLFLPHILFLLTRLIFNWLFNIKEELSYFIAFSFVPRIFHRFHVHMKNLTLTCATFDISFSHSTLNDSPQYDNVSSCGRCYPSTCIALKKRNKKYWTSSAINTNFLSFLTCAHCLHSHVTNFA